MSGARTRVAEYIRTVQEATSTALSALNTVRHRAHQMRVVGSVNVRAVRRARDFANRLPVPLADTAEVMARNDLRAHFDAHETGLGLWKWLHYFEIYERHLARFRGSEVHIVEVGVFSGGSIDMWKKYFGDGCQFYGVDIEPECKSYERPGVQVFIGDQADPEFWRNFRASVPRVDILVDDGGHLPEQQMTTLEAMLVHISPGGVYLCEDVQGEHNQFHSYIDALARPLSRFAGMGPFSPTPLHQHVGSVHRYPQVVVIEKPLLPVAPFDAPKRGTEWQPGFADQMLNGSGSYSQDGDVGANDP